MSTQLWRAVLDRDPNADGLFVYAVRSTKIYCRPTCASRRPRRDRVEFFPAAAMAEAAGYRACRRCHPERASEGPAALARVRHACRAIARQPAAPWQASSLARAGGTSVVQLQRAFRSVLGLSPREYIAACRRRRFIERLRQGARVTDAVYEAGFGSASRAYEAIRLPGMTPATYGRGGAGAAIGWATTDSRIGRVLVAATDRGACFVEVGESDGHLVRALREAFPRASIDQAPSATIGPLLRAVRQVVESQPVAADVPVDIQGTAFQWRVWRELTKIPRGQTRTYADVARAIGQPSAARAVARACASNPLALLVPCHRVVPAGGGIGGYRWGAETKRRLIEEEQDL